MLYLIDGYNLLFAMGVLLPGRTGPHVLEKARVRLLDLLHKAYGDRSPGVTVVFDAKHAPAGAPEALEHQGIQVVFAVHEAEADDLIEQLIRRASAPQQLTVISNDHRVQQAARRRHCVVQGCGDFLDWLGGARRPRPAPPCEEAKPERLSAEDTQRWLREFADLADDPGLAELFDPPWSEGGTD
jgi:hypothetical protein